MGLLVQELARGPEPAHVRAAEARQAPGDGLEIVDQLDAAEAEPLRKRIGAELARLCAADGYDLLARSIRIR